LCILRHCLAALPVSSCRILFSAEWQDKKREIQDLSAIFGVVILGILKFVYIPILCPWHSFQHCPHPSVKVFFLPRFTMRIKIASWELHSLIVIGALGFKSTISGQHFAIIQKLLSSSNPKQACGHWSGQQILHVSLLTVGPHLIPITVKFLGTFPSLSGWTCYTKNVELPATDSFVHMNTSSVLRGLSDPCHPIKQPSRMGSNWFPACCNERYLSLVIFLSLAPQDSSVKSGKLIILIRTLPDPGETPTIHSKISLTFPTSKIHYAPKTTFSSPSQNIKTPPLASQKLRLNS